MCNKNILIIGSGSVGKRHAINLAKLGCRISCLDENIDRAINVLKEINGINAFDSITDAFNNHNYDGVVIATPSKFHKEHALAVLKFEIPVLLEKPITTNLNEANSFTFLDQKIQNLLLLGYTWRWWPPLIKVQNLIDQNSIGTIRHVHFHMSAHLADWHPWERYQDFFMSKKDLGGGALLDESHWIDLMIWLFGMPDSLIAKVNKISDLEIDSDDIVDVIFFYKKMHITMHLDLFARPHEKSIRFVGEEGSILWTSNPNQISIARDADGGWESEKFECDRNDMFVSVAKDFVDLISNFKIPKCNIHDGIKVMKLIEAIRASSTSGNLVILNP